MKLIWAIATHAGMVRDSNQDSVSQSHMFYRLNYAPRSLSELEPETHCFEGSCSIH